MALVKFPLFRAKSKLSKYEAALRFAFAQKKILDVAPGETVAPSSADFPEMIVIADGDQSSTSITLPSDGVFNKDKLVEVINQDAAEAVTINSVACAAGEKTVIRFDGSSFSKVYSVALT